MSPVIVQLLFLFFEQSMLLQSPSRPPALTLGQFHKKPNRLAAHRMDSLSPGATRYCAQQLFTDRIYLANSHWIHQ